MSTGYLAALATLTFWTISIFVLEKLSRLVEPAVLNKAILFFSVFLLGIAVCILDGLMPWQLFTRPNASNWLWLGLSGILGKSIGDYCGYWSIRILGARRRSMITTLSPGFIWLFGLIILNETMNWLGIAAMLFTSVTLLLFINSNREKEEVKQENFGLPLSGLLFGIASAALTGIAFVLSKKTFIEPGTFISEFHGTWIRVLIAFSVVMMVDLFRNKHADFIKPFLLNKQKGVLLFFIILFGIVLGLSFALIAFNRLNGVTASTIFALLPVPVIVVNLIIYKKKISLKSWFYSLLAIAGVMILVWRNALITWFESN